jgi:hypothetical protein
MFVGDFIFGFASMFSSMLLFLCHTNQFPETLQYENVL